MPQSTSSSSSTTHDPVHFFDDFLKFGNNPTPEKHTENQASCPIDMPDSNYNEYFDHVENLAVRLRESGSIEKCVCLVPGDAGFMVAQWLDGSETMTEVPILPTALVCKKPAAVFKRPAAVCKMPVVVGDDLVPLDRNERAPYGCSRCRWSVGCTPSCWRRRNGRDPVSSSC